MSFQLGLAAGRTSSVTHAHVPTRLFQKGQARQRVPAVCSLNAPGDWFCDFCVRCTCGGVLFCRWWPKLLKTSFQVSAGSFDRLVLLHLQQQQGLSLSPSMGRDGAADHRALLQRTV